MNRSDAKFIALRNMGHTGSIAEMTLSWLQANGATSNSVSDAWNQMLAEQGVDGQRNDAWYDLLGTLGHEGSISDRERAFWSDGGVLPV